MYSRIALLSASFSSPSTRKGLRPKGFSSRNCLDLVWRVWRSTVINSKSIRPMARSVSTALIGWPVRSPYNRSFVCGYIGKQFMKIGSRWLFTKWNDDMAKWVFRISSAISHWYSWLPWKGFSMSTQWQLEMPIWHRTALEIQELLASNHKIYCMKYHLIIHQSLGLGGGRTDIRKSFLPCSPSINSFMTSATSGILSIRSAHCFMNFKSG